MKQFKLSIFVMLQSFVPVNALPAATSLNTQGDAASPTGLEAQHCASPSSVLVSENLRMEAGKGESVTCEGVRSYLILCLASDSAADLHEGEIDRK